jgi:hypothetical protein
MSGIHHSLWSLKDEYTDVVIIINNGKCQIGAHKIILSAASEFFRKLFKEENDSISLPEVSRQDMNFILELIYRGRTYLEAKHYHRCLEISKMLELSLDGRTFSFFGRRHGRSSNHFSFSGLRTAENIQFSAVGAAERLILNLWTDSCQR